MAGIMDAFGLAQQQDTSLTNQAVGLNQQGAQLGTQIIAAAAEKAEKERIAQQQKLEGELAAQEAGRVIATSLGANPDSQNFALAQLGQQFWDKFNQAQQVQKTIEQKESVGFFDNPIQYFANQLTVGQDVAKHNAIAIQANTALNAMQQINATVTSSVTAQRSIAESVTRDSIAAAMDAQALGAKIQSMELQQRNLSYDMDSVKLLMSNNDRTLQRAVQMNNIQVQQQQLAISAGHLALAQKEASQRAADRATKLSEMKEDEAGWAENTRIYNIGRGIQGFPPVTPEQLKTYLKSGTQTAKKDFEENWSSGMIAAATGNKVVGGSTVGQSALTIMKNNSPLNNGMQETKEFLAQVWQKGITTTTAAGGKPTEGGVVNAVNELVPKQLKVMAADVTKDPYGKNIYRGPDLKTLSELPSVKGSKFGQTVLYTQVSGGATAVNPDVLIDAGLAAVQAGTITPQEFTNGFVNMFAEAKNWNNTTKNFKAVNLPLQSTYNASVYTGTNMPFGRHEIVDLSNATQVNNFLMRRMTRQKQQQIMSQDPGMYFEGRFAP